MPADNKRLSAGIELRGQLIAIDFSRKRLLGGNDAIGRNAPTLEPHRDMRLTDTTTSQLTHTMSEGDLTARFTDGFPHPIDNGLRDFLHIDHYSTESDNAVNTRCNIVARQTIGMPKDAETSDFWIRLTRARESCIPPKSMIQEDIAKELDVGQTAVTRWKTGTSLPRPKKVKQLADGAGVRFDWLYSAQGDMRPSPNRDSLTAHVMETIDTLTPEGKIEILKAAITQKALEQPELASQLQIAQRIAEAAIRKPQNRTKVSSQR